MNGEDDRGPARPGKHPSVEEPDIVLPVRPRKKAKPPPNIITAGGVDMARGHASGIQIREGGSAEPTVDQPRVVIGVETDLRKLPTHKRIVIRRDPAVEGAARHGHATPVSTGAARPPKVEGESPGQTQHAPREVAGPPSPPPETRRLPVGMRLAFAAVLLLLLVGVAHRSRAPSPPPEEIAEERSPPPPPLLAAPAFVEAPRPSVPPPSAVQVEVAAPAPAPAPPPLRAGVVVAPRPIKAPAPPSPARTTFTPPFQLPSEKN
jgi:hypothetical protein